MKAQKIELRKLVAVSEEVFPRDRGGEMEPYRTRQMASQQGACKERARE